MPEIVTLTCPNCGGKLQITEDLDRFACGHCGAEHLVERSGGTVSLDPVMDRLDDIKSGSDRTASELAIQRLTKDLEALGDEINGFYVPPEQTVRNARLMAILLSGIGFFFLLGTIIPGLLGHPGDPNGLIILVGLALPGWGIYKYKSRAKEFKEATIQMILIKKGFNTKKKELEHHQEVVKVTPR